ncbi:MAG: glycosyltransferase family 2 protein [Kouleothrix sp.]|nr:glycosyltransferase family 2 protein [Kouleothrix sp.]
MADSSPSISVVICAHTEERWEQLVAAVDSVRRQSRPALEIVVVVDHNPALLERARHALAGVAVVENHEQRGLGGARNSGIAAAQGQVIAFLDDDAVASPGWLDQFALGYRDPEVVGVGGAIEPIWQAGRPDWFPAEFDWVIGCTYRGVPPRAAAVRNLIGCNMSFRREVFEQLGTFRLGYGCDETELCIRVRQRWPGKRLLYQPAAAVRHHVSAARATWRYFRTRCYFEGGSKAVVAWLAGARDGLDSERSYTLRVLPAGVLRGLADTLLGRDRAGIARSGAIVAGLAITTAGYVAGSVFRAEAARRRGWVSQAQAAA